MARTVLSLTALLALVTSSLSTPTPELYESSRLEPRSGRIPQTCHGESCSIANLSGSSGHPYKSNVPFKDGSKSGDCCIIHHNPAAAGALYKQDPSLKSYCARREEDEVERRDEDDGKQDFAKAEADLKSAIEAGKEAEEEAEEAAAGCKPFTLIFAKGTDDTGRIGTTVGPDLKTGLDMKEPGKWAVLGVEYNNGNFGNKCVGLPGGVKARGLLERTAKRCPGTKIVMSGYSQGAMVARNGVAYSTKASHKNLKGLVTFGDPFNGAPVKNFNKPLIVYCAKGDRVCYGRDIVSSAHLSYAGMDTTEAVRQIIGLVH